MKKIVKPGERIGIVGGGQLGRMLALAAANLGIKTTVLTENADCPAAHAADELIVSPYRDAGVLDAFSADCAAVTYEFENIPLDVAEYLASRCPVRPGASALAVTRDRLSEKTFLNAIGVKTADFAIISYEGDVKTAYGRLRCDTVLKTRFSGYDGKGQALAETEEDALFAYENLGEEKAILERGVPFVKEFSVVAARNAVGEFIAYDPSENICAGGMLRVSKVPSGLQPNHIQNAIKITEKIAINLDYVGVLAVEFFLTEENDILVNEIAPRVHNSGHWTPEACVTGQFEQHIRAICGWDFGDIRRHSDAVLKNLIGDDILDWERHQKHALRIYGKSEIRPGRKMGHVTELTPFLK